MSVADLQRSLAAAGLYLGANDGNAGPLTADALACALTPQPPPLTGRALALAIPAGWWATPNRIAMLYAMIQAETEFRLRSENLNYDAAGLLRTWPSRFDATSAPLFEHQPEKIANLVYANRNGNGPVQSGDGWAFRGRGWAQLTGRANYAAMNDAAGCDLTADPDAANQTDVSAKIVVALAQDKRGFLAAADAGDVTTCREIWNGGRIGLTVAIDSFNRVLELWNG